MNKPFRKTIPIIATSKEEYEAFIRYIHAKKDNKSYKFEFNISTDNKVKVAITDYLK